jgi:membrane peptidoglycan carboxypeptidase
VNLAALGLGAMTVGVTPLDMALAYAVFPNGGVHNSGICYTKVTDSNGRVLLEGKSEETRVLNEGVAYIMTDVLETVVSDGIAYDAAISGERVGGKTGTTEPAGHCLIILSQNEKEEYYISVVMKTESLEDLYDGMNSLLAQIPN